MPILEMKKINKSFTGVRALRDVDFSCERGEVHVLIGENGAGKSTLLKILTGAYQKDSGEIFIDGNKVEFNSTGDSIKSGVAMVYQELSILPYLTVAQNVFLNAEKKAGMVSKGLINDKKIVRTVREMADKYGIEIDPNALAKDLPLAKQQMAEILKVLVQDPDIIILDEPTSSIAREEVDKLYNIVMNLKAMNKAVIFISHRMEEIFRFGDRATVLKDGSLVGTLNIADTDEKEIVKMMVGRDIADVFPRKKDKENNKTIFSVNNLSFGDKVKNVSFELHEGEIIGVAGIQGHGQAELLKVIAGVEKASSGDIVLNGEKLRIQTPQQGIKKGIGYIPGDRKQEGLMLEASVRDNLSIVSLHLRKNSIGFIDFKKEKQFTDEAIKSLKIKTPNEDQYVNRLSGGNQQKVVLGKEIATNPKLLLFDEPTRGIDVATKQEFYRMMRDFANKGVAVIMYSSDLLEVVGLSDKVLAMYEGEIISEITGDDITEENIMMASVGIKEDKK